MYYLPFLLFRWFHNLAIDARRKGRPARYLMHSVLAGAAAGVMIGIGLAFSWLMVEYGFWWVGLFTILFMVVPPAATWLIRYVAVPLGSVKTAFYLGSTFARAGKDAAAYGYTAAAWALSRRPSPGGEAWLALHREARKPLGDAEIAVTGLMASARGDADSARQLMRSTTMIVENHAAVRELVGEWLAVDAAARGAWIELARDSVAATFPATPLTYFLEGVAARRTGAEGAPGDFELWARWALAPYRRATRELLNVVRAMDRDVPPSTASTAAETTSDTPVVDPTAEPSLDRAIATHLAIGADPSATTKNQLAGVVTAWDLALEEREIRGWLAKRALELEAPLGAADRAVRDIAQMVVDDLAAIADVARLGAPPPTGNNVGLVGQALARRLRHGRLDALEGAFERWAGRRSDDIARSAIDEWREFVALHAAYTAAVEAGGIDLRRLAFPHAFTKGNRMAAWLWNSREEYALSHAISRWLLDEALAVGDAEAIELGHRNCALEIPTRLGRLRVS